MLRLKTCLTDCNIPQGILSREIGWSRPQVNLTLNKGRFPADAERFRAGVRRFAEQSPAVLGWLRKRGLGTDALFDQVGSVAEGNLQEAIDEVAARAMLTGPRTDDLAGLARAACYLLIQVRRFCSPGELTAIEARAAGELRRG